MGYILDKTILLDVSNSLRDRGDKVVLTHGAFDLFHVGHFELLRRSKKQGDILIVGIESDDRIQKYKSRYRPIIPFKERMQIVSALNCVDFVLPITGTFSEKDYLKIYKLLNPSIVTFGSKFAGIGGLKREKGLTARTEFKLINHRFSNVETTTTDIIKKIIQRGEF